uniref:Retinol dehydrogenase 11 n=1 Tax=Schistocephalus solidus TaxID=70667 RepID=A0A0V0JAS3_SCHSO
MPKALCLLTGRLDGKLAIVTGANSGIGKETTAELARRGAKVIMACRNKERAEMARKWILDCYTEGQPDVLTRNVPNETVKQCITPVKPGQLVIEELDTASFASIKAFAERVLASEQRIDFLINNAGVMACPYGETADGLELQIGTNHFGHFLLTELLMPAIKRAAPGSRIICVSSVAHKRGRINTSDMNLRDKNYGRWKAYTQSKLANVIHARQLALRHKDEGIVAVSVHPGVVSTDLWKGYMVSSLTTKTAHLTIHPLL